MKQMYQEELLENETIEKTLSPHPLSFMGLQSLCIFLIVWGVLIGWFANFSEWKDVWFGNYVGIIFAWSIVLLIVGVIASLLTIRWRIFFLYLGVVAGGIGLIFWQNWQDGSGIVIPYYTILVSIIGFLIVELYRRSHRYIISNQRIVFKGGVLTKQERTLRYDKVSDINSKQGILGQIFGFGTIIPISQSGFGLGSDSSFAAGGVQVGEKKAKFMGIFGGGKEVQTPRARSYYELHGVHPYKDVKKTVEGLVQGSVIVPYQQEQVAFQKEQVDIQKQMRDLLKKQTKTDDEETPKE
ncbi:putative membrane protein [Thermoplasmatales archaeon SCGC AB-539-C06]|nr:putative membrane protein [Thermoplasmatales archaeon SCGC AB-539-C06]